MKKLISALFVILFCISTAFCATKAIQIESSISGYTDDVGNPNANGTIEFFTSDSYSGYKDVYSDTLKTAVISQPISLNDSGLPVDSNGNYMTIFADGIYWMRLKDSDGNVLITPSNLSYVSAVDLGGLYIDIGSSYGYASSGLTQAVSDYSGTGNVTFLFKSKEFLNTGSLTIPTNIKLFFMNGGYLTNSGTIAYNGQITLEKDCYISNSGTFTITGNITGDSGSYISNSGTFTLNNATVMVPKYSTFFTGASSVTGSFNTFYEVKTTSLNVSSSLNISATGNITLNSGNILSSAGNFTMSSGNATISTGNATISVGNFTLSSGNFTMSSGNATISTGSMTISTGELTITTGNIITHKVKDKADYVIIKSGDVLASSSATTFMTMSSTNAIFSGHIYITQQYDDSNNGSAIYKVNYTLSQGWIVTAEQVTGNYFTSGHIAVSGKSLQYYIPYGFGIGTHITIMGAGTSSQITFSNFTN